MMLPLRSLALGTCMVLARLMLMMLALRLSLRVTGVKPGPADAHDASLGVVFGAGMVEPGRADGRLRHDGKIWPS